MILSDRSIQKLVDQGFLPEGLYIGPSSVDLTLSDSFSKMRLTVNSLGFVRIGEKVDYVEEFTDSYIIRPGRFVLASTAECIKVPRGMCAYVEGRSSVGRIGLQVQNAGFVDEGFYGQITLELANQSEYPIELIKGCRICQLVFVKMDGISKTPYIGKYNGQYGATGSRTHLD